MQDLLRLERKGQEDQTSYLSGAMIAPIIDEDYWSYRVKVSEGQGVVGFPKFFTIGIGFAEEEDWNTNLPYTCEPEKIFHHIAHNKGNDSIPDERVIEAIKMIQAAAAEDKGKGLF
jgi:hypothetical protein